ncbi:MAG: hypothetical protein ACRDBG_02995 [Waterburya sp.]
MSNDPRKFKTGIAVTGTASVGGDTITTNNAAQTLQNKSIDADTNTITNISNDEIKAGAAIDAAKIADGSVSNAEFQYLDGVTSSIQTQLNNKASDADVIKKDGSVAFTAAQSMGGFKLTSVASPTVGSDAANKSYVDAVAEGLKPKAAVRVATTANITIATALNSGDVIDGVTLANGDRVLVKDQTSAEENGIYVVSATPARSTDFDSLSPIDEINGSIVAVQEGTVNAGKIFVQQGVVATLDTDPINFVFFNSSSALVGGDGITVSGNNVSVDHDGEGLTFVATQLALELDGATLSKSASGLKVADQGISNAQINNAAAIDASKIADGSVSNAEFQFINSLTSNAQTQLDNKASTTLNNLGTTAINASLIPATDNTINAGTSGTGFARVYTRSLYRATDNSVVVNVQDRSLHGTGGTLRFSFETELRALENLNMNSNKIINVTDPTNPQDAATKAYVDAAANVSPGDIQETSFSMANNQASPANVTGLAFANGVVRGFKALLTIEIDATTDLYEVVEIIGVQRGADWSISYSSSGDDSQVLFSITTAGQIQYTSANLAGFTAGLIKFRAIVTSV